MVSTPTTRVFDKLWRSLLSWGSSRRRCFTRHWCQLESHALWRRIAAVWEQQKVPWCWLGNICSSWTWTRNSSRLPLRLEDLKRTLLCSDTGSPDVHVGLFRTDSLHYFFLRWTPEHHADLTLDDADQRPTAEPPSPKHKESNFGQGFVLLANDDPELTGDRSAPTSDKTSSKPHYLTRQNTLLKEWEVRQAMSRDFPSS